MSRWILDLGLQSYIIRDEPRRSRTDEENMIISVAERLAKHQNYQFGHKRTAKTSST
jgi:hypothetical protein